MIELTWRAAREPRQPQVVMGFGAVALTLYQRVRGDFDDSHLYLLGQDFLAIKAEPATLPWVDGLGYLSPCRDGSTVYVPANLEPNIPVAWLEAYFRSASQHDVLYWPAMNAIVRADEYLPAAIVEENNLLEVWHGCRSQSLATLVR